MELDQLKSVEEMAAALMSPAEIAILLNQDPDKFIYLALRKKDSEIYKAYQKGRLTTKLELRKKVITLAKAGSPQAEMLADKYLLNSEEE